MYRAARGKRGVGGVALVKLLNLFAALGLIEAHLSLLLLLLLSRVRFVHNEWFISAQRRRGRRKWRERETGIRQGREEEGDGVAAGVRVGSLLSAWLTHILTHEAPTRRAWSAESERESEIRKERDGEGGKEERVSEAAYACEVSARYTEFLPGGVWALRIT